MAGELDQRKHKMLPPFTAAHQFTDSHPLIIEKSEGVYVYDNNGKKYLDALAGLWSIALGGNEQRLVAAANKQMQTLPFYHSFWNRTTNPAIELAQELIQMFTANEIAQVFFTNSGSEANDTQVKLVWYYFNALGLPNKKKIISRKKAYHGSTVMGASLSGLPPLHESFDLPLGPILFTECPHHYKFSNPGETEEEFSDRLAASLDELIIKEGPDTVAAFIAEPLMGAGGVILPPKGYWPKIQEVLKKHDVLLIADEVVCGFGRTGYMFGSDLYHIKPDLISLAKALSSAYIPIGAVLISKKISDQVASHSNNLGSFSHGFTYSGHPVACAVALETMKLIKEKKLPQHVKEIEPLFQDGLRKLCSGSPIVGEVRGIGLIAAIEFIGDLEKREAFPSSWKVGGYFGQRAQEIGLLVRTVGDTIAMSPPLVIAESEIEELLQKFGQALEETVEYVTEKRKM